MDKSYIKHRNPGARLIEWYQLLGRSLPWRETKDPYRIWVSEIILQQTRVEQGRSYYQNFVKKFPDIFSLASANLDSVLKSWEGLGYYSRARNMHSTAQNIVEDHGGRFPEHHTELIKLKGIGPYTSRAIGSLAFGNKAAVVDGNVFRFLSRYNNDPSPIDKIPTRNHFTETLDEWIQSFDPGTFNQAIMDLGALVCTPRNPSCPDCPVQNDCLAYQAGTIDQLPFKSGKTKRTKTYSNYYLVKNKRGEIAIRQRPIEGLWAGLWEIPQEEKSEAEWKRDKNKLKTAFLGEFTHILSHRDVMIRVYARQPEEVQNLLTGRFIPKSKIRIFAFSRAVLKIFDAYLP